MKFRLVEYQDFPNADDAQRDAEREYKRDIEKAKTQEDKDTALKNLISFWSNKPEYKVSKKLLDDSFKNIRYSILRSMSSNGYSNTQNKFLRYIIKNSNVLESKDSVKVSILQNLINLGLIDYKDNQRWFSDRDLYDRPDDEFEYTVKIFNIAQDENIAKRWFNNTEYLDGKGNKKKIDVKDLYFNGKIKESGLHDNDNPRKQNIWNQVELWSKKLGEVDRKKEEKKFSLNDYLRYVRNTKEDRESRTLEIVKILTREDSIPNIKFAETVLREVPDDKFEEILNKKVFKDFEDKKISSFIKKELNL